MCGVACTSNLCMHGCSMSIRTRGPVGVYVVHCVAVTAGVRVCDGAVFRSVSYVVTVLAAIPSSG